MDIIILLILIGIITASIAIIAYTFFVYTKVKINTETKIKDLFEDYLDQFEIEEVTEGLEKFSNNLEKVYDAFNGWTKMGCEFNKMKTRSVKKNPNHRNSPKV